MSSTPVRRRRVLLASASTGGTISAVRQLAAKGFDVRVLSSEQLAAAKWSRAVSYSYRVPPEIESGRFISKLLDIGKAEPGQVILPTSDQTAWLYSSNMELLAQYYCLYQPSNSILRRLLDKKLFAAAADKVGIATVPYWDPENENELQELAPNLPYPILLKPRTHVSGAARERGSVVRCSKELLHDYARFVARNKNRGRDEFPFPDTARPILQQFVPVGNQGVYSVSGFIDRSGELFVTRRSRKVFQRSRPVGVGVCYEAAPPDDSLSRSVRALCLELGYFGIFEVEFLPVNGGWAAIDFNPRLYNQIGLDSGRGLPLPLLACLGALDEESELRDAIASAQSVTDDSTMVLYDRFTLNSMLAAMYMTSRISRKDLVYWKAWAKRNGARAIDVAVDKEDPLPGVIHALSEAYLGVKAAQRFFQSNPRVTST